jgi:hypothetical protein
MTMNKRKSLDEDYENIQAEMMRRIDMTVKKPFPEFIDRIIKCNIDYNSRQ